MITVIVAIVTAALSFFAWSAIHELSHYVVASRLRKLLLVNFKLYPHMENGSLVIASVQWVPESNLSAAEDAAMSIAPRVPDLFAALLAPMVVWMPTPWAAAMWVTFFGAGLVDLAFGSIGTTEHSDLQWFARGGGHNVWMVRALGWTIALLSAGTTITELILVWR